ncbi:SNF2-related protein [Anaerotruncus massiliensis (ex Liu et al. 2021)]|uniref:SNF2-related protein n=1 Tax=Anaerotruncus massiliensis (ex Liu et al. 2021) TaxID=2321404 RepID=UPI003AB34D12
MRFQPHEYQRYCIQRILEQPYLALWLDMGLGKTVITLTAVAELKYNRFAVSRVLIVAPKKVAEATWQKEAAKWGHLQPLRISTVLGSAQQRIRALAIPADIYVVNRENVPWLVERYRNDWPFDMVVLDESSSFKNWQAKRFKAMKLVRPRIRRLVELTGTPSPNGLMDLWAPMFLLDGGQRLGKTVGQYRERYFDPDRRNRTQVFSYAPKEGAGESIHEALNDICVSMKAEDYLQLPDCVTEDVPVVLDSTAAKAYKRLEREMLLEVPDGIITAGTAGVLTNKLLQLCDGAVYDSAGGVAEIHGCKIEAFLELIEMLHGEPALVFYSFQHDRARLLEALRTTGLRVRVYGGPADDEAWNRGEVDILLAHPASCAYGLNLQDGGHHVIWFGLTWSLEQYQQANKRLHRQGQRYPVIVHHLVTQGGVDEDVLSALQQKGDTQAALMEALKARIDNARRS